MNVGIIVFVLGVVAAVVAAEDVAASDPTPAARIQGCKTMADDGQSCIKCTAPSWKRSSDGTGCECAKGFVKVGKSCRLKSRVTQKAQPFTCAGRCGQTYVKKPAGGFCHCDYFCANAGDCCNGAASVAELCPGMAPSLDKARFTSCDTDVGAANGTRSFNYRPGMCWCDEQCAAAGDCCPQCTSCKKQQEGSDISGGDGGVSDDADIVGAAAAAAAEEAASPLAAEVAAAAAAMARGKQPDDCGAFHLHSHLQEHEEQLVAAAAIRGASIPTLHAAETIMQTCQAADQGPPAEPLVIQLYWHAGQVCSGGQCVGGKYSAALVKKQIEITNSMYAHAGIQFAWDGVIHKATASSIDEIDVGFNEFDWICKQDRQGDTLSMNVITSPAHIGGIALGVTLYPSYFATKQLPDCTNWIYVYEKTLPGQGGISQIDGGLADSGHVLTHEIGHQLMLAHTWHQTSGGTTKQQCKASASMDIYDILAGRSDGVRDTTAQSLNTTDTPTNILRFVNCDPVTGAYNNQTNYAQQSCTAETGFPQGSNYYNNYNNLMSYGDRTCLRTITPGQAARARCAIKCMWRQEC